MTRRPKHFRQLVLQLNNKQVALLIFGAREAQVENLSARFTSMFARSLGEAMLLHSGAKMYALGGGWYRVSGYGYRVINKMPERFKLDLRVDEQQVLNTLGYAA